MATSQRGRIAPDGVDRLRIARGVTLEQLADATGIPYSTLRRRLKNAGTLTLDELTAISAFFDVEPESWLAA